MNTTLWRCLLAPRTSWHAWRLARAGNGSLTFDAAWRRVRIDLCPEEMPYREYGHLPPRPPGEDRTRSPWN
jgi:hypothetical protein